MTDCHTTLTPQLSLSRKGHAALTVDRLLHDCYCAPGRAFCHGGVTPPRCEFYEEAGGGCVTVTGWRGGAAWCLEWFIGSGFHKLEGIQQLCWVGTGGQRARLSSALLRGWQSTEGEHNVAAKKWQLAWRRFEQCRASTDLCAVNETELRVGSV